MRMDKIEKELLADFEQYFQKLETDRMVCQEIYKVFSKIIKIKRIYARPKKKGHGNEYYCMTFEKDERAE